MKKQPLHLPFLLALSGALLSSIFLPNFRLLPFVPLLVHAILKRPLLSCLWIALGSGILVDLLCSSTRFGLYALNFCSLVLIAYRFRTHFFETSPLSFTLFSILLSALSTLLQILLLIAFGSKIPFELRFTLVDLLLMPLLDGLYAFLWFICPLFLYTRLKTKTRYT